ncbi:MAG: T9SS type A sorting domain-containing protein [Calditrichaeota bacterium]|nr:T9SS type A sorting domain-containing protein [Calditrichota bacterium]
MKKFYKANMWLVAFLMVYSFSTVGFAQITITSSDILGLIGTSQVSIEDERFSIPVNVGLPGANQIWDFRSMDVQDTLIYRSEFLSPGQTAYADSFPQANFVQHVTDLDPDPGSSFEFYGYLEVASSSISNIGFASVFSQTNPPMDTTIFSYDDNSVSPLPLNFNDTWTEVSSDTTFLGPDTSFYFLSIDSTVTLVDAWGTVQLDIGDFECLRIRDDVKTINKTILNGSVISSSEEVYIQYSWVSKSNYEVANIQSQSGNTDPLFTDASGYGYLISTVTGIDDRGGETVSSGFALSQNYPNPFNPTTTISFELPVASDIRLEVFDITGKRVETLVADRLESGVHEVVFDASHLPSGFYLYQLKGDRINLVKRMILLK